VGAGESAIASLLSTNPDPDHVTHAHAGERPGEGADEDNSPSPSPSIDSDKENNLEMVNLLHPNTPGKASSPHVFSKQNFADGIVDSLQQEDDQEEGEEEELLSDTQKPVKV